MNEFIGFCVLFLSQVKQLRPKTQHIVSTVVNIALYVDSCQKIIFA